MSEESNIQEPSIEWDEYEQSPSYFDYEHDNAFMESSFNFPDTIEYGKVYDLTKFPTLQIYPEYVEEGRVYDFSHLPPLPNHVTSPPDNHENLTSTPKKKKVTKKTGMIKKIKKTLFK